MSVTITKTRTKEIGPNMEQTIKVVTETTQPAPEPIAKAKPLAESAINPTAYALLICLCAVCAWGFVEVVKEFIKARMKLKNQPKPWYYYVVVRGLAVVMGGLSGWFLAGNFGAGVPIAVMVGCAGGALSSVIVKLVKARIAKATQVAAPK